MDIAAAIAAVGLAVSVATFFIGRTTAAHSNGLTDGELKSDIRHIKESLVKQEGKFDKQDQKLDGIIASYEDVKVELEKLKGRMFALEQKVKVLHGE
jgi:archaellum component FlaC